MKTMVVLTSIVVVLSLTICTYAIDRDAKMIDTIGVEGASLDDDADSISFSFWGETALATIKEDWSFLIGGGVGALSPDAGNDMDFWEAGLGLKHYVSQLTSVSLIGSYRTYYDLGNSPDVTAGSLAVKHRLLSAKEAISPFVSAALAVRSSDRLSSFHPDTSSEFVGTVRAGCDLMISDTIAFVFEAAYFEAEELSDGWLSAFFIKGYWN